ncbi:hypothetical protein ANN_04885 [Periplaneta americana]|uniref:C2H2-type domain-containing protein n=1 Tax=Periplaneta americana TaxID=6978 RepID=A0ABQ8T9I9_PERAM|nr:hypothetical protein ANN_04885 [Periplaneta americana]
MENDTTINASIMSDTTIDIDTVMSELTEDHTKETAQVDEGRFSPSSNLQASASEETMPNSSIKMSTSELEHESNIYKNAQKSTNSIPSNMLDPTLTVLPSDREEGLIGHNGGIETTPGKIHVAAKISLSEMRNSDVMRRTVNEHTYSVQDVQSINDRKQKYISNPRKNDITLQQTKRVNVLKASSSNGEVCLHEQNISVRTTPDQVHLPWQFNEASALDNDESENCDVFKRRTFGEFGPLLELFNGHRYCSGKEIHTTENEASDSEMQESSLILGESDAPSPQTKQNRRKVLTSSNRENGVLNGHSRSAETIPGKEHIAFQMCVQGMLGNNSAVKIENSNIKRDQVANNRKQNETAIEVVDISSDSSSDCEYIDLASESFSDSESETEQTVTKTRHLKKKKTSFNAGMDEIMMNKFSRFLTNINVENKSLQKISKKNKSKRVAKKNKSKTARNIDNVVVNSPIVYTSTGMESCSPLEKCTTERNCLTKGGNSVTEIYHIILVEESSPETQNLLMEKYPSIEMNSPMEIASAFASPPDMRENAVFVMTPEMEESPLVVTHLKVEKPPVLVKSHPPISYIPMSRVIVNDVTEVCDPLERHNVRDETEFQLAETLGETIEVRVKDILESSTERNLTDFCENPPIDSAYVTEDTMTTIDIEDVPVRDQDAIISTVDSVIRSADTDGIIGYSKKLRNNVKQNLDYDGKHLQENDILKESSKSRKLSKKCTDPEIGCESVSVKVQETRSLNLWAENTKENDTVRNENRQSSKQSHVKLQRHYNNISLLHQENSGVSDVYPVKPVTWRVRFKSPSRKKKNTSNVQPESQVVTSAGKRGRSTKNKKPLEANITMEPELSEDSQCKRARVQDKTSVITFVKRRLDRKSTIANADTTLTEENNRIIGSTSASVTADFWKDSVIVSKSLDSIGSTGEKTVTVTCIEQSSAKDTCVANKKITSGVVNISAESQSGDEIFRPAYERSASLFPAEETFFLENNIYECMSEPELSDTSAMIVSISDAGFKEPDYEPKVNVTFDVYYPDEYEKLNKRNRNRKPISETAPLAIDTKAVDDRKNDQVSFSVVVFNIDKDVAVHLTEHQEEVYACMNCDRIYKMDNYSKLYKIGEYSGLKPSDCDVCCRKFSCLGYMRQHVLREHPNVRVKCNVCDKAFLSLSEVTLHAFYVHHMCGICDKVYADMEMDKYCDILETSLSEFRDRRLCVFKQMENDFSLFANPFKSPILKI